MATPITDDGKLLVTNSRYVNWFHQPDALAISERTGCEQAKGPDGYVLLGLGRQVPGGSTAFGWDGRRKMAPDLVEGVAAFASGLERCTKEGRWRLVAMTSNYHLDDPVLAAQFGREWAEMVDIMRERINSDRVEVLGGSDIEPSWGKPSAAIAWVDAYAQTTQSVLVNGPSADGCPTSPARRSCNNGWNVDQMVHVMWGARPGSLTLPQVYTPSGTMARQWANLADVAVEQGLTPLFVGALTQSRACRERRCAGTDIGPRRAFRQLRKALDESRLSQDVVLIGGSDIGWG